jgi:hypothetical protein
LKNSYQYIHDCDNLNKIDPKAFSDIGFTGELIWRNNPKVSDEEVFALADHLSASEYTIDGLQEVPENAIHIHNNNTLSHGFSILLSGDRLKTVQPNAFASIIQ